jgi:hypothetical protein
MSGETLGHLLLKTDGDFGFRFDCGFVQWL